MKFEGRDHSNGGEGRNGRQGMVTVLERQLMTEPFYKLRFNTRGLLPLLQEAATGIR